MVHAPGRGGHSLVLPPAAGLCLPGKMLKTSGGRHYLKAKLHGQNQACNVLMGHTAGSWQNEISRPHAGSTCQADKQVLLRVSDFCMKFYHALSRGYTCILVLDMLPEKTQWLFWAEFQGLQSSTPPGLIEPIRPLPSPVKNPRHAAVQIPDRIPAAGMPSLRYQLQTLILDDCDVVLAVSLAAAGLGSAMLSLQVCRLEGCPRHCIWGDWAVASQWTCNGFALASWLWVDCEWTAFRFRCCAEANPITCCKCSNRSHRRAAPPHPPPPPPALLTLFSTASSLL